MRHVRHFSNYINEGRSKYDGLASKLVTSVFKHWVNIHKSGGKDLSYFESIENSRVKLEFDLYATLHVRKDVKGFTVLNSTGADGRDFYTDKKGDEVYQTPHINIDFAINPDWLPGEWSTVYFNLADVMRHEMEHITQDGKEIGNYKPGKPDEDDSMMRMLIQSGVLPHVMYLTLPKEIDANIQGLRYEAKKRKIPMIDAVNNYLDTQTYLQEDPSQRQMVLDTWRRRAAEIGGIPKF